MRGPEPAGKVRVAELLVKSEFGNVESGVEISDKCNTIKPVLSY